MAPKDQPPPNNQTQLKAASGGPLCVGIPTYAEIGECLSENGYEPIPIKPGCKAPAASRWSTLTIDERRVADWRRRFPEHGVGLRTGRLVGVDIDILDPELAWTVTDLAQRRLGQTLLRVGQWPKCMLLYRTDTPILKITVHPVEILGLGQQFVAFGIHSATRRPYAWPNGETPLDVALDDLPRVDPEALHAFGAEARALIPDRSGETRGRRSRSQRSGHGESASGSKRDANGRVIDGRDAWLSQIAFHVVHGTLERGDKLDARRLTAQVWDRFEETTDLSRPKKGEVGPWDPRDAHRKVTEKLRLHREGRLPPRQRSDIEATYTAPTMDVASGRAMLDETIRCFCDDVLAHYDPVESKPVPRFGIRATVGLGKSAVSRTHLVKLRCRLREMGAPDRIVVLTPSHALAEETAGRWRDLSESVAVLRGYERTHPVQQAPMCRDLDAVRAALSSALDPQRTVCTGVDGARCRFFNGCLKQANRAEVTGADIIVAPYDALYTGFSVDPETVGIIVVDEGCWQRAVRETVGLTLEELTTDLTGDFCTGMVRSCAEAQMADRMALRQKIQAALEANGPGPVAKTALRQAGLSPEDCREAAELEKRLLTDPGLAPGLTGTAKERAFAEARRNARIHKRITLWKTAREVLEAPAETTGRLRVLSRGDDGFHRLVVIGLTELNLNFRHKPILHLDATLRPAIAKTLLPGLEVEEIDAAAPHMHVTLVTGSFAKTAIVPDERATSKENRRRRNNLADCVEYVRWHARRLAPGRVLVITYKATEAAFADIPGVETAHFNAIAGLDSYNDVAALFVIGRPLPRDTDLLDQCAALMRHDIDGVYQREEVGVRMRDGSSRAVSVIRHTDETAEVLRAAICDDEMVQAIGRGRGVNRSNANPLEVHIMADVALPQVHDQVVSWDAIKPDVVQRMLLGGVAVDSPADAVALHPDTLGNEKRAQKAFERAGFKRQFPIVTSYRGMSLKSAAYKRPGRGRSWQTAYWLEGDPETAQRTLEAELGSLADWEPSS